MCWYHCNTGTGVQARICKLLCTSVLQYANYIFVNIWSGNGIIKALLHFSYISVLMITDCCTVINVHIYTMSVDFNEHKVQWDVVIHPMIHYSVVNEPQYLSHSSFSEMKSLAISITSTTMFTLANKSMSTRNGTTRHLLFCQCKRVSCSAVPCGVVMCWPTLQRCADTAWNERRYAERTYDLWPCRIYLGIHI